MRSIFGSRDFELETEDFVGSGLVQDCPFMFMVNALGEEGTAAAFIQSIIAQEFNFLIPALKQAEDLRKMRDEIESSCGRLLEAIQNKSKENPKLQSKKPVNFSLVIMLSAFDKKKKLIGFGLGKSMIICERNKSFHTLKPAVLLEDGQVRGLPCGNENEAADAESELFRYSVIADLNPQDEIHLISTEIYQFLKLEEKISENKERLISLSLDQEFSDFLNLTSFYREKLKSSNTVFQDSNLIKHVSPIDRLKEEISSAEKSLNSVVSELHKNPAYSRKFWHDKIKAHMKNISRNHDAGQAMKARFEFKTKNLIAGHNEIKVSLEHEKRFLELSKIKKELDIKLAHLSVDLEEASKQLSLERLVSGFTYACMHIPEDDYMLFELRLYSRNHEICDAFKQEHMKCESEVHGLISWILELRQRQLRHYEQLFFNETFQKSPLGLYLILLALSNNENLNESLRFSYLTQDLDNFPDEKRNALREFISFLKDVSMKEHLNIGEIVEKLATLIKFLNSPNFVQTENACQTLIL